MRIAKSITQAPKSAGFAYLLAASKTKPVEMLQEAYDCGQRIFGENYVDQILEKHSHLPDDIQWHFIGHLQSNKVKKLIEVPNLAVIETIDSQKLAQKVNSECDKRKRDLGVFIQVLSSDEDTKNGIPLAEAPKLAEFIIKDCPNLKLKGLMSMGKLHDHEGFRQMYELK
jgi:pyridoxal phosphate enzyme (YggS family)